MQNKYKKTLEYLHGLDRFERIELLQHFDLTQRQREILETHEFDKSKNISELADVYCVCERVILQDKQKALAIISKGIVLQLLSVTVCIY